MLVSFYILAYNHEKFIARAIKAALDQDYSLLEIIISDDFSTDDTWEIIQRTTQNYDGPHKIMARRNTSNFGIAEHINAIWRICNGQWIVASAGDDTSLPNRVSKIMQVASQSPNIKLVQSILNEVDVNGNSTGLNKLGCGESDNSVSLFGLNERLNETSYAPHGAAMAYSRELVEFFQGMLSDVIFEDNIVNLRAELIGNAALIAEPLVNHTNHNGQITRVTSGVSSKVQEERRARRLNSDISSTKQNISDIKLASQHNRITLETYRALMSMFENRCDYFETKRKSVISSWPLKLIYLYLAWFLTKKTMAPFNRDDFMRALLPYPVYRLLRKYRG